MNLPDVPPPVAGIPEFWSRLQAARTSFLVLDYDGTLAPFHIARMEAFPIAGVPDLIRGIRDRTRGAVAVVSGRPLSELLKLLDVSGILMIGSHGYEFRYSDGTEEKRVPLNSQREGLFKAFLASFHKGLISRIETKTAGIALHTRGLPEGEARSLENWAMENWTALTGLHNLEVRNFKGGVEHRCLGKDKGSALEFILSRQPDDALCVYIGDDETDEDAFRVLKGRGFGIKVGASDVPTSATGFLKDIEAVKEFLKAWTDFAPVGLSGALTWIREDSP